MSQSIINGAIPAAGFYLLGLDLNPERYRTRAAREKLLMILIDSINDGMTGDVSVPDAVCDLLHRFWVRAFRELLLRSDLLELQF